MWRPDFGLLRQPARLGFGAVAASVSEANRRPADSRKNLSGGRLTHCSPSPNIPDPLENGAASEQGKSIVKCFSLAHLGRVAKA